VLKTFKIGGVHPVENKLSANKAIEVLALPKSVFIPLGQHIGSPAEAIVSKGDTVKVGQLVAKTSGLVSANIHSSVSGTVKKIEAGPDTSGYPRNGIYIDVEGDIWDEKIDRESGIKSEINLDSAGILAKIQEAGIVGLGGATFPTHVKLTPPKGMKAEVLLINGVECEPYLTSDHRMMLEHGPELVVGIKLLMKALDVNKAVLGIENNKPDAITAMTQLLAGDRQISVVALKIKYPQGGEKQLIKAVTGREVPSGALPISVGAVVANIATTFAVYEAVQKNKPLFERIVTVTGKSVLNPSNFKVRIGTPISKLIAAAGGLPENCGKIINGGPMMGKAVTNTEIPVTKGTSGVLMMPENEARRQEIMPCIRCSRCVSVCPMGLEPFLLMTASEKHIWERAESERIMDCMECGSCSYICPANRPLLDYIRLGKGKVGNLIRTRKN
jgi:electron transport complex protein RnfC